jgi:NADH dehydrogenase FAD-containing subunit
VLLTHRVNNWGLVMVKRVLLGAGHAHVMLLQQWIVRGQDAGSCVLVSDAPQQTYSGMVPGWLAGEYPLAACQIDVPALCAAAGVIWQQADVIGLNLPGSQVLLASQAPLPFHQLSINLGAAPAAAVGPEVYPVKPFASWAAALLRWDAQVQAGAAFHLAVAGGGFGGFELSLALARRFASNPGFRLTWLTGPSGPLARVAPAARARALRALSAWPIRCVHQPFVSRAGQPWDAVLVATGGAAPAWLQNTGLALDPQGFVAVDAGFCSLSHPQVFAAGDIARRLDAALVPSGVNAVRAGPILAQNLIRQARGAALLHYQPRPWHLQILALPGDSAMALYGPLYWTAPWVKRWKRRIDTRFMQSLQAITCP